MSEEVYDETLSSKQKVIMLRNGGFSFDRIKKSTCCGHDISEHLYLAKSKEICICDGFKDKESKLIIPQKRDGKNPRKEDVLQKQKQNEQLDSYIQTLAFMSS